MAQQVEQDGHGGHDGQLTLRPSQRSSWNYQAWDAFRLLHKLYYTQPEFLQTLTDLRKSAPRKIQKMRFDQLRGYIPPDSDYEPSLIELLIPQDDVLLPSPGEFHRFTARCQQSWQVTLHTIGAKHPWLEKLERARLHWGLRAPWAAGWLVETMQDWHAVKRRSKGDRTVHLNNPQAFWDIREKPQIFRMGEPLDAPAPHPAMSDREWNSLVAAFRQRGLKLLKTWRQELPAKELWVASPTELDTYATWLFKRITPPYLKPEQQAAMENYSPDNVSAGIRKAAALLEIKVSPGVKGPRRTKGLERTPPRKSSSES